MRTLPTAREPRTAIRLDLGGLLDILFKNKNDDALYQVSNCSNFANPPHQKI